MTHYIFSVLYLVALSWCADRYHKRLSKVSNLQMILEHPNAKKEYIWKEKDLAIKLLRKEKQRSYIVLISIWAVHQIYGVIATSINSVSRMERFENLVYPIIALTISLLILLIIFWLRGKGGGLPRNSAWEKMPF